MNDRHSLIVQWSDEDQLYLVTIPEFSDIAIQPCTYGKTYKEAITNAQEAIACYLESCQKEGLVPPQPVSAAARAAAILMRLEGRLLPIESVVNNCLFQPVSHDL
jgi:antitoxin HicB